MREVMKGLERAQATGECLALATVVRTEKSAPRAIGTSMFVTESGQPVGSVSGGCVEAAVMAAAEDVLESGMPELHSFGISDDLGLEIGLTCGGTIEILIQPYEPATRSDFAALQQALASNIDCAMVTVFDGPQGLPGRSELVLRGEEVSGLLDGAGLSTQTVDEASRRVADALAKGRSASIRVAGVVSMLIDVYKSPRNLLIFGAIDFTTSLAELGRFLGFHVIVCDARSVFATPERIPAAHQIVIEQPWRYLERQINEKSLPLDTAVCVLTHDSKFDIPVLDMALKHGFSYVGAMGSRRTDGERRGKLTSMGHGSETLSSLRSPIGLDLGARTPHETALSIMAEIVASTSGTSGLPLHRIDVPIHERDEAAAGTTGSLASKAGHWAPDCTDVQSAERNIR